MMCSVRHHCCLVCSILLVSFRMHLWQRALLGASLVPKPSAVGCSTAFYIRSAMASAVLVVPVRTQLTSASLSQALQRLEVVPGDISQPGCGIQPETQERLLSEVDFVLHAAASIQFTNHVHEDLRLSYLATESILKLSQRVSGVAHVCLLTQPHSFTQQPGLQGMNSGHKTLTEAISQQSAPLRPTLTPIKPSGGRPALLELPTHVLSAMAASLLPTSPVAVRFTSAWRRLKSLSPHWQSLRLSRLQTVQQNLF